MHSGVCGSRNNTGSSRKRRLRCPRKNTCLGIFVCKGPDHIVNVPRSTLKRSTLKQFPSPPGTPGTRTNSAPQTLPSSPPSSRTPCKAAHSAGTHNARPLYSPPALPSPCGPSPASSQSGDRPSPPASAARHPSKSSSAPPSGTSLPAVNGLCRARNSNSAR